MKATSRWWRWPWQRAAPADVDAGTKDDAWARLLHQAAGAGYAELVEALITAGADVNARTEEGETPLHQAAVRCGGLEVVGALIAAGADVNASEEGLANLIQLVEIHA